MFSTTEECFLLMVSAHPSATFDPDLQLFLQVSVPRAELLDLYQVLMFGYSFVQHNKDCLSPSSSLREHLRTHLFFHLVQLDKQFSSVGYSVTEIICVEFPWNLIVNLKLLYQKKRQENGS